MKEIRKINKYLIRNNVNNEIFRFSLGAQKVLCAFRCALSFTTVFGQFGGAEFKKVGYIICIRGNCAARAVKCCARPRNAISAHEGRRPLNMGFKMTAIINLVGTKFS